MSTVNHPHWLGDQWDSIAGDNVAGLEDVPLDLSTLTNPHQAIEPEIPSGLEVIGGILKGIIDTIGGILGGVIQAGVGIFSAVFEGVVNFIGGIASAIGNLFGGTSLNPDPPLAPPEIFNPIKTNLEAVLAPSLEKVDTLLEDSRGLGDETKTINQQMRDLIDPENDASELWNLQKTVNELTDSRLDLQEEVSALNRKMIEEQAEFISRTMFIPGGGFSAYDNYFSVSRYGLQWRVQALGNWTGQYTLTSAYNTSRGWEPVIDFERVPNMSSDPRVRYHDGADYSTIIQYWVRRAEHFFNDKNTGGFWTNYGSWERIGALDFVVQTTAPHDLFFKVQWDAATYEDLYGFRILRNGSEILRWGRSSGVGPRFPWEDGVRTRILSEYSIPLNKDDLITYEIYSDAGDSDQRWVNLAERKVSWLLEPTIG